MSSSALAAIIDRVLCLCLGDRRVRKVLFILIALFALITVSWSSESWDRPSRFGFSADGRMPTQALKKLKAENARLKSSLQKISPNGVYIVVDTARNRLYLHNGEKVILDAVCSTGNGKILKDVEKDRQWLFNTPRGEFRVLKKVHDPVWTKPDWAFIEEGENVPTSFRERIEEGMLGDYALHIGNSYLIHGTLYRRLLGRSVTHGCVRLGDADLEKVYKTSVVGTPVFIF